MNIQPVIQRELRTASRRRETWNLRLVFGGGVLLAFVFGMVFPDIRPNERGQVVLICLAICGFVLSLFTGPYLTADVVSSEKREGTLGLLFLTPLNGWQIVLGKMVTHSVQVGYALVGSFTLFFLPLLIGGVVWDEVMRLVLTLLLTLLLSLACGIFWSTVVTEARTAVLATVITMLLLTLLPWLPPFLEQLVTRRLHLAGLPQLSPMTHLIFAFEQNYRFFNPPGLFFNSGAFIYWGSAWFSLVFSFTLLGLSGWLLPRIWRQAEAGERTSSLDRPATVQSPSHHSHPRLGNTPPLLWWSARGLQETWWLRWVRGIVIVFFAIMLCLSATTNDEEECFIAAICAAYGLHLITRIQLALSATRRLNEDRRTGALEALLTTPISETELVGAYHESLKRAFRRPMLAVLWMNAWLLLAVFVFFDKLHMRHGAWAIFTAFFVGGAVITVADFAALRWLCLRESLRSTTQMKATGRAFGWLCMVAWPTFGLAWVVAIQSREEEFAAIVFLFWALACAGYDWILINSCRGWLLRGLRRRVSEG